ncbi:hypothetical protein J1N35_005849 [Gossypium stocksii]|uniref:Phytocyanin domain-containing protein n=1 Tax=Gossypium stocksii TaxID=47602 RepID=A0A9D4AJ00_9ROSI|nr:hypothetical protein J1N35_005849 [Gossypium stocksii]
MEDKIGRLIILIMCCSILKGAVSQVFSVGDENGWSSEVDYGSWSEKYNFTVGDVLEFTYNKGQHNVFEVTESTYRTCDASSGVLAKYESGDDKVELTESKNYWFICNVSGHCLGGMRFGVDVKAGNTSSTNLDPTPSANSGNGFDTWSLGLCIFAFQFLLHLSC